MFRKSKRAYQLNVFTSTHGLLQGKALDIFEDETEWHNQFLINIIELINEELFKILFADEQGAPNSSIRVLVGMMILKEAHGWSDSQLFDNCRFHFRVRRALGLSNLDDSIPAPSTYYLFRKRIVEWEKAGNGNLLEQVFAQVTKSQIAEFHINGAKIRMDSKILGSNIAKLSRYELVHETLRMALASDGMVISKLLSTSELSFLQELFKETCSNISYRSNDSQLATQLIQLGTIIYKILNGIGTIVSEPIEVLDKVFHQQFEVVSEAVVLLPKERLSSGRIDSPHDPDCRFRKKAEQKQRGYSINITETCNPDNNINLTTSVIVEPADTQDIDFMIPAIEHTQQMFSQPIETVNTDGAYHSETNQKYCKEKNLDFILSAISGLNPRHELSVDSNGQLTVLDLHTNTIIPSFIVKTKKADSPITWKIINDKGKRQYFTQKDIDTRKLRKQIAERSKEETNLRNNVEATIFQLGYHYRSNKSRYRSLIKHRMWANMRCLWINFVRILKHITSFDPNFDNTQQNHVQSMYNSAFYVLNTIFCTIFSFTQRFMRHISPRLA